MIDRNIQTTYYARGHKRVVKINKAIHANSAVLRCVDHMQQRHYIEAAVAEVFDLKDGALHAVITSNLEGRITIVFKREVQPDEKKG